MNEFNVQLGSSMAFIYDPFKPSLKSAVVSW